MSDAPSLPPIAAQLAQIRDQLVLALPGAQSDAQLRRALLHAQSAIEARLGLPNEAPKSTGHRRK